jgi:diacylglycerol kinase family enzyme
MWSIRPNIGRSVPSAAVRIALAANQASGGGLEPEPLLEALRRHGAEVELFGCQGDELARLVESRPDRVVVAGGDGTIGPAAAAAGELDVPLALLPTGTANDFARANELPDSTARCAWMARRRSAGAPGR